MWRNFHNNCFSVNESDEFFYQNLLSTDDFFYPQPSLVAQSIKNLPECRRPGFNPWVKKILWRRKWQTTPISLPWKSHGQRSLQSMASQRVGHDWTSNTYDFSDPLLRTWECRQNNEIWFLFNLAQFKPRLISAQSIFHATVSSFLSIYIEL